jgi:hypothetical protein
MNQKEISLEFRMPIRYFKLQLLLQLVTKYVDGVDVGRYQIGWSKQFVKYGRNLTRPRKSEFFEGERLLVRQIPAQPPYAILTCFVDEILVNDNNSMISHVASFFIKE